MNAHQQFADDLALYAAGALTPDETAAMEKHLEGCAACRRELEQLRGDAALLALSAPDATPPARARQRLMSAIAAEPHGGREPRLSPARADWWTMGWAWAASIAAGALLAWSLSLRSQSAGLRHVIASLDQIMLQQQTQLDKSRNVLALLSDPGAARFTLTAGAARKQPEAKAVYGPARRSLVLLASNLPALPPQKTYELWLIPASGAPIPAGLFKPDASGSATLVSAAAPQLPEGVAPKAFAVTVEPEGGSAAPTSQPIMSGSGA